MSLQTRTLAASDGVDMPLHQRGRFPAHLLPQQLRGAHVSKFAQDTSVSSEKSRGEIESTLSRYGATGFMYEPPMPAKDG